MSGSLPPDGAADIAGVRLPAGRRIVVGGDRGSGRPAAPVLWVTGAFDQAASTWLALRESLHGTGLVPLLLSDLPGQPGRPFPGPAPATTGQAEADELEAAVLAGPVVGAA